MKKELLFLYTATILTALAAFCGCIAEDDCPPIEGSGITVTLAIDDIISQGLPATRGGTVPSERDETNVENLYLLFFKYTGDGSGSFVKRIELTSVGMNGRYTIPYGNGLDMSESYAILAVANISGYTNGDDPETFLNDVAKMTERQAMEKTVINLQGVGTDEADNSKAILPANLAMSTRVVRMGGESGVTVNLTRNLARFDVYNGVAASHDLVSASVWGAASSTPVWHNRMTTVPQRMERFYGIARTSEFTDIKGGLYSFENYVATPRQDDDVTTCLILGLKPKNSALSETTYYRVNIAQSEQNQNLLRNHVYTVTIESVENVGANSEYNAWTSVDMKLKVSIDGWNQDGESIVQTDGVNTLVVPVKRVRLGWDGGFREYTIFTKGNGTLAITKKQLPKGISAILDGKRLIITASPLAEKHGEELMGAIELSFAGLRSTVAVIQSAAQSSFLTLNRYEIPEFNWQGKMGISDGVPFVVTASGAWTAIIHNTTKDELNPGFSFDPDGKLVTELRSNLNPLVTKFNVYTTGDNPSKNSRRYGFMVVSLDADRDGYSWVVVLSQQSLSDQTRLTKIMKQ